MPAKRTQVLVCAGTGCTIGNSGELITEFEKEIKALGLENEIEVLRIVMEHFYKGRPVHRLMLN